MTFGSAIYFQTNSSSSTITNTLFISNVAQAGGAIYFQSGSSCNIANSSFILNSVATGLHPQGGALFLESNSSVRISSSTFYGNSAQNGGSIYQSPDSRLTMDSSIFNASVGGESGGAIYIRSGNLTASNTLFNNCTSNYQASSIYMSGGASVILANVSVIGGYLTGGLTSNTLLLTHDVDLTVTNSSLIWDGGQSLGYSNGSHRLPISYGGVMTALSGSVVVLSNLHFSGQYVEGDGGILVKELFSLNVLNYRAHSFYSLNSMSQIHRHAYPSPMSRL